MAGAGYKLFNTGDVLTAAQVNTYLQEQAVMRFANATARTTALSGVLAEGMMSYLDDTNSVEVYNGSAWVSVGSTGDITGVTAGTGISGGGTSGDVTITNSMATAIDAKGDLIVGTGADTFSRLAVGSANQILTVDSSTATGLKWAAASAAAFSGVAVYKSADQSISHNVSTAITFNSEYFDTDNFHSTSTNTSRITIPSGKAGKYLITWVLGMQGAGGIIELRMNKNGSLWDYICNQPNNSTLNPRFSGALIMDLAVADYLELFVYQSSGSAINCNTSTQMQVAYLGA